MSPDEACNYHIDLDKHYGYVYCITFPNGKRYVGQSRKPWKERWKNHQKKSSGCIALHNALNKYASMPLTWELLDYADSAQELTEREAYYILSMNTLTPNGYNIVIPTADYIPARKRKRKGALILLGVGKTFIAIHIKHR